MPYWGQVRLLPGADGEPIRNAAELALIREGGGFVESPAFVIFFLSLAFFGNSLASITWSLVSAIAPERLLGLTGGMFNFVGNLASVGVPIVIGQPVTGGDFAPAITFIAATALAGVVCFGLVVGRVERIPA